MDGAQASELLDRLMGGAVDDVMDLVDVLGHAARTEIANAGGVQFQVSNSSSRWAGWAAMNLPKLITVALDAHEKASRAN
jgi:hypothetical protein